MILPKGHLNNPLQALLGYHQLPRERQLQTCCVTSVLRKKGDFQMMTPFRSSKERVKTDWSQGRNNPLWHQGSVLFLKGHHLYQALFRLERSKEEQRRVFSPQRSAIIWMIQKNGKVHRWNSPSIGKRPVCLKCVEPVLSKLIFMESK